MALTEEYFKVDEAENVSRAWKFMQIGFYLTAAVVGMWSGYIMQTMRSAFEERCHLYGVVVVTTDDQYSFDPTKSEWGSDSYCDFSQYTMVSSFIFAIIWAVFFLMCGSGGKSVNGLSQPWRIVLPALIFNFIFSMISVAAVVTIIEGTTEFCMWFDKEKAINSSDTPCSGLNLYLNINSNDIVTLTKFVQYTALSCALAWLFGFLLLVIRAVKGVDFVTYKVCVHKRARKNSVEEKEDSTIFVEVHNNEGYEPIEALPGEVSPATEEVNIASTSVVNVASTADVNLASTTEDNIASTTEDNIASTEEDMTSTSHIYRKGDKEKIT